MDTNEVLFVCIHGCGDFTLDEMIPANESELREYHKTDPTLVCPICEKDEWYITKKTRSDQNP
jgi:hypothetical protein